MIPKVQTWRVRVVATADEPDYRIGDACLPESIHYMDGSTKALIRIGFRMDYPCYWGRAIKISLASQAKKV